MFLLSTVVSPDEGEAVNNIAEPREIPNQALSGEGCRPTRLLLFNTLKQIFPYVYVPKTQAAHPEFPLDWQEARKNNEALIKQGWPGVRAVFIGSRDALDSPLLSTDLPDVHTLS